MKEKKQSPKVISFKKYQDEMNLMEAHLVNKSELLVNSVKRSTELNNQLEQTKSLVTSLQNTVDTYKIEIRAKIEIITRLHDELADSKAQFNTLSSVVNNLDKEIDRLKKNQKRWYHFF